MWDLLGAGLEPVSPALAGGFLTPAPPGSPVWLLSVGIVPQGPSMLEHTSAFHSFLLPSIIPLYGYLSVLQLMDMGYFTVLAVMNSAAMTFRCRCSRGKMSSCLLGDPGVELPGWVAFLFEISL